MSCMEHECVNPDCDFVMFDNTDGPSSCPFCGDRVMHYSDEGDVDLADFMPEEDEDESEADW